MVWTHEVSIIVGSKRCEIWKTLGWSFRMDMHMALAIDWVETSLRVFSVWIDWLGEGKMKWDTKM